MKSLIVSEKNWKLLQQLKLDWNKGTTDEVLTKVIDMAGVTK